jgi:hypothetical protein
LLLPFEDRQELDVGFSENILFAAEALAHGYRIRGIERYSNVLRDPASQLLAALEALRFVFRQRALRQPAPPYSSLNAVVKDFDQAWTQFEQRICFCYFSVSINALRHVANGRPENDALRGPGVRQIDDSDLFTVLLSETVLRALDRKYFSRDEMQRYEPYLMFAIPRLAIVAGLLHMPEYLNLTAHHVAVRWLRDPDGRKVKLLVQLQQALRQLTYAEVVSLERMLLNKHEDETMDQNAAYPEHGFAEPEINLMHTPHLQDPLGAHHQNSKSLELKTLQDLYRTVSGVADEMQSGERAREFVTILGRVFKMHVLDHPETQNTLKPPHRTSSLMPQQRAEAARAWLNSFWRKHVHRNDSPPSASATESGRRSRSVSEFMQSSLNSVTELLSNARLS